MSMEGKTNDWQTSLHKQLKTLNITKETRGIFLFNGKILKKSNDGLLMKCVGEEDRKEKVEQLHGATCREEGPGLYRRLQRWDIYWPKKKSYCDELQASYKASQETIEKYLDAGILCSEKIEAERLKKKSEHYFLQKVRPNGHCILLDPSHKTATGPINFKYIKK
ncbi:hypothetical protein Ahy_A09g043265 [Arachis hypogaea]|uniref:Integrase zinc-binding domain-containing protein n=1 Tax=Arachis hypogaea TaxID=3818 RepID=A0A445BHY4_ARAHY|nr:hypothetical protein Ahy_A09g043265 [Arachis hypogaea]